MGSADLGEGSGLIAGVAGMKGQPDEAVCVRRRWKTLSEARSARASMALVREHASWSSRADLPPGAGGWERVPDAFHRQVPAFWLVGARCRLLVADAAARPGAVLWGDDGFDHDVSAAFLIFARRPDARVLLLITSLDQ